MNMNRRDFLRSSTALTLGLSAAPLFGAPAAGPRFRTALIGTGWWGMNILGEAMASGQCQITAMCDVDDRLLNPAVEKAIRVSGRPA